MAGIGDRLIQMMPGSTTQKEEADTEKHETKPHTHTETRLRKQEGGINTAGYFTKETAGKVMEGEAATCNREYFTKVEDRPRVIERHEFIKKHRPVEREYVVEIRFVGERELPGRTEEVVGVEERIVEEAGPKAPCE